MSSPAVSAGAPLEARLPSPDVPYLSHPTYWHCVDGFRLHCLAAGQGEPVLLVHGGGTWLFTFHRLIPLLTSGHTVLAVDMPGHGYTVADTTFPDYGLDTTTRCLAAVLDSQGVQAAHLVGASWGGGWALHLAQSHPERVRSLSLIAPSGPLGVEESRCRLLRRTLLGEMAVHTLTRIQVSAHYRRAFHDRSLVTPQMLAALWQPMRWPENRWAQYHYVRRADWSGVEAGMAALRCPVQVVWGREDRYLPVRLAERFQSALPEARLQVLERCGHLPHEEQPEAAAAVLRQFWETAESRR